MTMISPEYAKGRRSAQPQAVLTRGRRKRGTKIFVVIMMIMRVLMTQQMLLL